MSGEIEQKHSDDASVFNVAKRAARYAAMSDAAKRAMAQKIAKEKSSPPQFHGNHMAAIINYFKHRFNIDANIRVEPLDDGAAWCATISLAFSSGALLSPCVASASGTHRKAVKEAACTKLIGLIQDADPATMELIDQLIEYKVGLLERL